MCPHRLLLIALSTVVGLIVLFATSKNLEARQTKRFIESVEVVGNRRLSDKDTSPATMRPPNTAPRRTATQVFTTPSYPA